MISRACTRNNETDSSLFSVVFLDRVNNWMGVYLGISCDVQTGVVIVHGQVLVNVHFCPDLRVFLGTHSLPYKNYLVKKMASSVSCYCLPFSDLANYQRYFMFSLTVFC